VDITGAIRIGELAGHRLAHGVANLRLERGEPERKVRRLTWLTALGGLCQGRLRRKQDQRSNESNCD
jgi:hypothetical protein